MSRASAPDVASGPRVAAVLVVAGALFAAPAAHAAQITFGPGDSYDKLEAAKAGDEVIVAPGKYTFRVHLIQLGTAQKPIVIRAADPNNRPVWDLSATLVENAPGSSTDGDRGRACWQVDGGTGYIISGIEITGCHDVDKNSAALRYYNASDVTLRDVYFHGNDNGLTGGTQDSSAVVEWSEISSNGDTTATSPTHNLYIYGGLFVLRYSYIHDSLHAENFHVRARESLIEANWFARAKNYEGDLMTSNDAAAANAGFLQSMIVRGNVFVQAAQPDNTGQILAVFNDTKTAGTAFEIRMIGNTFVGAGKNSAVLHLSDADKTPMQAEVSNNIVFGTNRASLVDDASGIVVGASNWMATGGDPGPLVDTVFGAAPGFKNPAMKDYTLLPTSDAIGKASGIPKLPPATEYYKDEVLARRYRLRASTRDIGAFESTTTDPSYGPYDPPPPVDAGAPPPLTDSGVPIPNPGGSSGGVKDGGAIGDDAGNGAAPGGPSSGCGCAVGQNGRSAGPGFMATTLLLLVYFSRDRARRRGAGRR